MAVKANKNGRTGLARALSKLGYCSRSQATSLIGIGRVRLNGRLVRDPEAPVELETDLVEVDSIPVGHADKIYLMMNKPRGLVTTARDEKGRNTIYSLLAEYKTWLAPVGRLDMASEGLLLLTNDSEWGARIASPEARVGKTYHVQIGTVAWEELLNRLRRGTRTQDGELLTVKHVRIVREGPKNSWLEIVLEEGKNRHIRRMFDEFGIAVLQLIRVAIGKLELGDLPKGQVRKLTDDERRSLLPVARKKKAARAKQS